MIAKKDGDEEADQHTLADLIQLLSLFRLEYNLDRYNTESKAKNAHPINSATSIGSVIKGYTNAIYDPLLTRLVDFVLLDDLIRQSYQVILNRKRKEVPGVKNEPYRSFSGQLYDHTLADPYMLPLISAFRVLLVPNGTRLSWVGKTNITDLWNKNKEFFDDLVRKHLEAVVDEATVEKDTFSFNGVSRAIDLWQTPVRKIVKEFKL